MEEVFWCKNCLNMSTRPRITFDYRGWCNACQWMEEKSELDWIVREKELLCILDAYRSKNGGFDKFIIKSSDTKLSETALKIKRKIQKILSPVK